MYGKSLGTEAESRGCIDLGCPMSYDDPGTHSEGLICSHKAVSVSDSTWLPKFEQKSLLGKGSAGCYEKVSHLMVKILKLSLI